MAVVIERINITSFSSPWQSPTASGMSFKGCSGYLYRYYFQLPISFFSSDLDEFHYPNERYHQEKALEEISCY
jgi:hypothetical protein